LGLCQSTALGDLLKNHRRSYLCEFEIARTKPLYSPINVRRWHTAEMLVEEFFELQTSSIQKTHFRATETDGFQGGADRPLPDDIVKYPRTGLFRGELGQVLQFEMYSYDETWMRLCKQALRLLS
jgi:hypothetical protein